MESKQTEAMINNRVKDELRNIRSLVLALEDIPLLLAEDCMDGFCIIAEDVALRSEVIACKMRHLLYHCGVVWRPQYLVKAAEMQGMSISEHDGMFEIVLPCLLPKRKARMGSEYLTDPLFCMLDKYTATHPVKLMKNVMVCFIHEYDKALPETRVRDYDNMEQKLVMDAISTFLMVDDGGLFCDMYNTTVLGDADRTRIFIMSPEQFPAWYLQHKHE